MGPFLVGLEDKLDRLTREIKIIKWLALIGLIILPSYIISILYFLINKFKLTRLKNDQALTSIFNSLRGKSTKELKSVQSHGESLKQKVVSLLLAYKSAVIMLSVTGIILLIIIGIIGFYNLFDYSFV